MTVKTGRLSSEAVMVVAVEDFASFWSVLIFPFFNSTVASVFQLVF